MYVNRVIQDKGEEEDGGREGKRECECMIQEREQEKSWSDVSEK